MTEDTELIVQVRLIERRHLTAKGHRGYTIERTLDRRDIATVPTLRDGEDVLDSMEKEDT